MGFSYWKDDKRSAFGMGKILEPRLQPVQGLGLLANDWRKWHV